VRHTVREPGCSSVAIVDIGALASSSVAAAASTSCSIIIIGVDNDNVYGNVIMEESLPEFT